MTNNNNNKKENNKEERENVERARKQNIADINRVNDETQEAAMKQAESRASSMATTTGFANEQERQKKQKQQQEEPQAQGQQREREQREREQREQELRKSTKANK